MVIDRRLKLPEKMEIEIRDLVHEFGMVYNLTSHQEMDLEIRVRKLVQMFVPFDKET